MHDIHYYGKDGWTLYETVHSCTTALKMALDHAMMHGGSWRVVYLGETDKVVYVLHGKDGAAVVTKGEE